MAFIPDDMDKKDVTIPWFEDAKAELGIKGHSTSKSLSELEMEIKAAMARLGGGVTSFITGKFDTLPPRIGYEIRFNYGSREGKIEIAALPIKKWTATRERQSKKQALYTVRDMLEAEFNSGMLIPGSAPLVPYLLDDGGRTLSEIMHEQAGVPLLSAPLKESEAGEVVEDDDDEVITGEFTESG